MFRVVKHAYCADRSLVPVVGLVVPAVFAVLADTSGVPGDDPFGRVIAVPDAVVEGDDPCTLPDPLAAPGADAAIAICAAVPEVAVLLIALLWAPKVLGATAALAVAAAVPGAGAPLRVVGEMLGFDRSGVPCAEPFSRAGALIPPGSVPLVGPVIDALLLDEELLDEELPDEELPDDAPDPEVPPDDALPDPLPPEALLLDVPAFIAPPPPELPAPAIAVPAANPGPAAASANAEPASITARCM